MYGMESRLGVTEQAVTFRRTGYETISFDYDKLNIDLAWFSRQAAETLLSVSTILDQVTALFRLAQLIESYKSAAAGHELSSVKPSITTEDIRSTILRAELFLKNSTMFFLRA
ncbi:hypothetical protein MFIFM68171_09544 [Madurella fahalii]|uniref:Uncharacterized protein n=1 Tax=Madurella fahalii TaxID=1157608 RepID=A0ABQ0GNQ3_9PEZI